MAIQAKANGLLIAGRIIEETETFWCFHALDEKRPKYIKKSDPKNKVFDGKNAVENAEKWQNSIRKDK